MFDALICGSDRMSCEEGLHLIAGIFRAEGSRGFDKDIAEFRRQETVNLIPIVLDKLPCPVTSRASYEHGDCDLDCGVLIANLA